MYTLRMTPGLPPKRTTPTPTPHPQLRNTRIDFEDLAEQISNCESSRTEGGNVGWVGASDEFLDEILPPSVPYILNPKSYP